MYFSHVVLNNYDVLFKYLTENSSMILPVVAMFSAALLIIGKLYYRIRIKFPVKVNCWFCNTNTSVPYNSANSWYCSNCDQYNGFCLDGSYNRVLTEQFNEKLNFGSWCSRSKQKNPTTNGLCRFCNINLELKVRQLAQFVPLNQANYDEEVTLYSEQLERVYRLCSRCQGVLEKILNKKQELFVNNQQQPIKTLVNHSNTQVENKRHPLYRVVIVTLSICLLLTNIPQSWLDQLIAFYPPADQLSHLYGTVNTAVPRHLLPMLGAGVQLIDCLCMRDATSLVNMFLWIILLVLPYAPVKVDHLVSIVQTLASIVFLISSITESRRSNLPRSVAANKPVQFQKLIEKSEKIKSPKLPEPIPTSTPPSVSDPAPPALNPSPPQTPTSDDLGFSKLNVSSRRVTRSQAKPFQTKNYASSKPNDLFRPKPINLSPPKLQLDKSFEYQIPLTRCSSQSSGFVSLSHQKDLEDDQAASIINDNIESVSQCGGGVLAPYRSPFHSPVPFPQYSPFSQFPPYAVMHFTPPPFDKVYSYANMSYYEPSLNLSSSTMYSQRVPESSWFQSIKNVVSSLVFMFLITSNIAILWKVFGEEYFKVKA